MKNRWLNITTINGTVHRIRKDRIIALSLWKTDLVIYVQTHIGHITFEVGFNENYDENRLDEKTFKKLRAYLDRATKIKGELNLDLE